MLDQPNDAHHDRDILKIGSPDHKADEPTALQKSDDADDSGETDETSPDDDAAEKPKDTRPFWRKHPIALIVGLIVLIAAIVAGVLWYLNARHFENTDDAFIDGRPISISAEVEGNITAVPVTDNQVVKAGDLLARIDDRNYTAAVANAEAQIDQAQAQFENIEAQIGAQKSQVRQAEQQVNEAQAALNFSNDENKRYQDLAKTGFGTIQRAQQSASDQQQKRAALDGAQSNQAAAEKQINVLKAQRRSAEAQIEQAKAQKLTADANLSRTMIRATVDGRVTRLTGAVGFVATQGQGLMVLVPLDVWVTANFKETQLADMRVGQPVDIEIDAFGRTYPGKINSIQAGSGTAFSLLPAQNATGNYVKVVQRIPVKITFDQRPDVELGPGMSVVPTVRVR
ncbi:HlyD family secretion protein [Lichenihabitans psoromatis]|uniref:HlyD family secretion protein n=1 Tax=Lichenihabitans psoromatis TaxID=2528642 RepID=UPI0013F17BF3|nr:HlyD family secretion protein [Lichenihabitans psoromatis]